MTLFIAGLIIWTNDLPWGWYGAACVVWMAGIVLEQKL